MKCCICGKEIEKSSYSSLLPPLCDNRECFTEQFWQEIINDKYHLFINHRAYCASKEKNPVFKGFGGAKYKIRKLDTGEIIETDNLWTNGELPEKYWDQVKDNAEFIK